MSRLSPSQMSISGAGSELSVADMSSVSSPSPAKKFPEISPDKREIGHEAVWTLSSAKLGNGVEQLRDGLLETFWQSDGNAPHLVNIMFHKKMRVQDLRIFTEFKLDESYTPQKISIRTGTGYHDLKEIQTLDLDEPSGWITVNLASESKSEDTKYLRAHLIQIAILTSHQNGRDTHLRQVQIFGPRQAATYGLGTELTEFSTIEFQQFACIR